MIVPLCGPYVPTGRDGEIVIIPTMPAIGNAVYNAIGVRIFRFADNAGEDRESAAEQKGVRHLA